MIPLPILLRTLALGGALFRLANAAGEKQLATWSKVENNLCAMYDGRVTIVGNQLFFMGGNYSFVESHDPVPYQELYAINLNQSFPVNGLINSGKYISTKVPDDAPWEQDGGAFWNDNTTLYLYAGEDSKAKATNQLWSFDVLEGAWQHLDIAGGNLQVGDRLGGMRQSLPNGMAYYAGGDEQQYPGLIKFNTVAKTWENETTPSYSSLGSPGPQRGAAEMVYLPYGDEGVLLVMGGMNTSKVGGQYGTGYPWDDCPWNTVDLYDIATKQWFNVPTTGDIPGNRGDVCLWMTPAQDRSSYTITIYGGWSLFAGTAYEDVYVLSVPSFQWIKISDKGNLEASQGSGIGRTRHRCAKWKEDHGFVVGGWIKNGSDQVNHAGCNPLFPPMRLLNLSTYEWQSEYDPATNGTYQIHPDIYKVIGGDSTGKSTLISPKGGWSDSRLVTIFSKKSAVSSFTQDIFATPVPSSSSTSPSSPTSTSKSSSKAPVAAIAAGATVGGIVLLALIGFGIFCWRRRKMRVLTRARAVEGKNGIEDRRDGTTRGIYSAVEYTYHKPELDATDNALESYRMYEADASIPFAELDGRMEPSRHIKPTKHMKPIELDASGVLAERIGG